MFHFWQWQKPKNRLKNQPRTSPIYLEKAFERSLGQYIRNLYRLLAE